MKKVINLDAWKRTEHFHFFNRCNDPFFGITANVDCTKAYTKAKQLGVSFFLYYMHKSLVAVNSIDEFRCRIEDGQPVIYDVIDGSTTVQNADELFTFAFLPYHKNFDEFYRHAKQLVDKAKTVKSFSIDVDNANNNVVHYSTIPWVSFTAITHERVLALPDSIPKITFGKYFSQNDKLLLPMSVNVHHGLADGLHVGKYFELFEQLLNL